MKEKKILICADDFGLSQGVNKAIIELASKQKIHSVSVFIKNAKQHPNDYLKLKSLSTVHQGGIHVGLHLNFEKLLSNQKHKHPIIFIKTLLLKNKLKEMIHDEIHEQIQLFYETFRFFPQHIDGHLHIQNIPLVAQCLCHYLKGVDLPHSFYIRSTVPTFHLSDLLTLNILKKTYLYFLGKIQQAILSNQKIYTNDFILGVTHYSANNHGLINFQKEVNSAKDFSLFFTHPGFSDQELRDADSYVEGREKEYDFLIRL